MSLLVSLFFKQRCTNDLKYIVIYYGILHIVILYAILQIMQYDKLQQSIIAILQ